MIPILPSASLSKDRGNRPSVKFILLVLAIGALLVIGYLIGYKDGKKQGEIKILKAVATIMVGALDKAAQ